MYQYSTTIEFGDIAYDVTFSYEVIWGELASHDCPASDDEIDGLTIVAIEGSSVPPENISKLFDHLLDAVGDSLDDQLLENASEINAISYGRYEDYLNSRYYE